MPASEWTPLRAAATVGAAMAAALAVDAFLIEPNWPEATEHELPLPGLPPAWEGARVAHLTDLHYGNPHSDRLFRWLVAKVNERPPDLILLTGDFIRRRKRLPACAAYLARLRSREGLFGVLGDHDFGRRRKQPLAGLVEALEGAGIRVLRNRGVELPGGLRVGGTDPTTWKMRRADLDATLAATPGGPPHLLLSHSPDIIVGASERGVPAVLCGHTHGGQVVLPFYGPPLTYTHVPRRFASGWSAMNGTRMYTGRGLSSHRSLRFLCRPEVAFFTLRSG